MVAAAAAGTALGAPATAPAAESRPLKVVADTATNGVSYRLDLLGVTERPARGRVTRDLCLRLVFRGPRRKALRSQLRCSKAGGFEYRSPSLVVANDRDPDKAPLVFGFARPGLGRVQVPLARGRPSVDAMLRAVPARFGSGGRYVFVARGMEGAPLGVRAIGRDGASLDGVLFPSD
jgi:hypothetical protein